MNERAYSVVKSILLNKDESVLDKREYLEKYEYIMPYIEDNGLCEYVLRSAYHVCLGGGAPITDSNLMQIMSFDFCLERASEYVSFIEHSMKIQAEAQVNKK